MKTVELSAALNSAQVVENLKNFVGVDAQGAAALMTPERLAAVAGGKICTIRLIWNSTDANKYHEVVQDGISCFGISSSTKNIPLGESFGIIVHIQRVDKNNVSSSQFISQTLYTVSKTYKRDGTGDGSSIRFSEWSLVNN